MDPEVQEVPIASDTPDVQEVPVVSDVVVVDDDDAAQHKDGPSASHEDPLEALEKSVENASENIASFASSIKNFTYEDQDSIYTQLCVTANSSWNYCAGGMRVVIPRADSLCRILLPPTFLHVLVGPFHM